jgi:hypothetical protein
MRRKMSKKRRGGGTGKKEAGAGYSLIDGPVWFLTLLRLCLISRPGSQLVSE